MIDETLEDLLSKIKEEFLKTLVIETSFNENEILVDIFFDNNVIEKIKTAIELARSNIEPN